MRFVDRAAVPGDDWQVHYALFSRSGFTRSLRQRARQAPVTLVSLKQMMRPAGPGEPGE